MAQVIIIDPIIAGLTLKLIYGKEKNHKVEIHVKLEWNPK
jgi:hypothetical protein